MNYWFYIARYVDELSGNLPTYETRRKDMGYKSILLALAVAYFLIVGIGCGTPQHTGSGEYILKYDWPEKPRVGSCTLRVNLVDRAGASVEGAEVVAGYDMPSMRGAHDTTETMKQNARGDYLLPIHFVMPGDWEIVLSARKDGREIATETIKLDI